MPKRALVLGSNGQDGSFLVEHLLRRGYSVIGLSRQRGKRNGAGQPALPTGLSGSARGPAVCRLC